MVKQVHKPNHEHDSLNHVRYKIFALWYYGFGHIWFYRCHDITSWDDSVPILTNRTAIIIISSSIYNNIVVV